MKDVIYRLLRHYTYDLKLKNKLAISHALLILFPTAILSGFLFVKVCGMVMEDTLRSEQALSAQTASSIGNLASHITYVSNILKNSSSIHSLLCLPESAAGALNPERRRMERLVHLTDNLTDNTMIAGSRWFRLLSAVSGTDLLCPESYLSPAETDNIGRLACVSKIPYTSPAGYELGISRTCAYLAVYFNPTPFNCVLEDSIAVKGAVSYIINGRGVMVCASDTARAGAYHISTGEFSSKIGRENYFSLVSYPAGSAYTAYFPVLNTDWRMVSLLPAGHITDAGTGLMIQMITACLLFTAAAFLIALKLSGSIADRIIAVARQMESVRTGRPKPLKAEETGLDEIGVLTDTYNYMAEEINGLTDSQKKSSEDLKMAEFRALQAQINPHFLYNTLDMINWLSGTGRKEDVAKTVRTLSHFYKLTLGKRGLMNTIDEELKHTELYAELQNMRYDNCVTFAIDVPDELSEYTIPKLTFQPIVENAWLHGIMGKEEKRGNILLTGWRQSDDILFLISDDGTGISPQKLESMTEEEDGDPADNGTSDSVHIGVYNTNLRLKRLYGGAYGLSFRSSPGAGTEVTIKIPAKHRENGPS